MKRVWAGMVAAGVLFAAVTVQAAGPAAEFAVKRLVVCAQVEKREPVGIAEKFPATQKEVAAFLEATGVAAETPVSFVWIAGGKEVRQIAAKLGKGAHWRTWTVKSLRGVKGPWQVEVRGADGKALATAAFTVE